MAYLAFRAKGLVSGAEGSWLSVGRLSVLRPSVEC